MLHRAPIGYGHFWCHSVCKESVINERFCGAVHDTRGKENIPRTVCWGSASGERRSASFEVNAPISSCNKCKEGRAVSFATDDLEAKESRTTFDFFSWKKDDELAIDSLPTGVRAGYRFCSRHRKYER